MKRGSRLYASLVIGSTMLQIRDSVVSFMNGSTTAVSGSGTTSMSLAWIGAQPRIELPSKPRPSSKTASFSSEIGMVKCCQRPRKSMNFRSTITAFLSLASPMTSLPLGIDALLLQSWLAPFAGADADHLVDGRNENLPVPYASSLGGPLDGFQCPRDHFVRKNDFHLHFWQEVDDVLGAPVELGVAFLTAEPLHLGDGEPEDAHVGQRLLHLIELEGLDDRFDLLHRARNLQHVGDDVERQIGFDGGVLRRDRSGPGGGDREAVGFGVRGELLIVNRQVYRLHAGRDGERLGDADFLLVGRLDEELDLLDERQRLRRGGDNLERQLADPARADVVLVGVVVGEALVLREGHSAERGKAGKGRQQAAGG